MIPLVVAGHGTRVREGQDECRRLVQRVASLLPDVRVSDAYVELMTPTIPDAVGAALDAGDGHAIVVPLMLGAGGHVLDDIPDGIEAGRAQASRPGATLTYTAHLGPDPRLRAAVRQRIATASQQWAPAETVVVFLGRGCSVADANADHVRLGRLLFEEDGYADVIPAFIQVTRPSLIEGLNRAYAHGARQVVVSPNFLFPGRLERWMRRDVDTWAAEHPDAVVRVADVIGDCEELAGVVVDRYRAALATATRNGAPVYLAGLDLSGRKVLVAGAGRVATRRVPKLLAVGADVVVVAPEASPEIAALAQAARLTWMRRDVTAEDTAGAWYILAATDVPNVNEKLATVAQEEHIFCVRADDSPSGSARTPATAVVGGLTVGVIGDRDPRLSAMARDTAAAAIAGLVSSSPAVVPTQR